MALRLGADLAGPEGSDPKPPAGPRPLPGPQALRSWVLERGLPGYRAEQVLRWMYRHGVGTFEAMDNLPATLRRELGAEFSVPVVQPALVSRSRDGTRKLLFRTDDQSTFETVLIDDAPRLTVCVSSQAGCAMGCVFCATAQLDLQRQLSTAEILGQVLAARRVLDDGRCISNVVFMGMGEPLANYDAVCDAIGALTASWGFSLAARRITVSTAGLLPQMERLAAETEVNVAVSLNATTDETRSRLMPVNRRYPIEPLLKACRALPFGQRRRLTFEYVLIDGVNDTPADASRLARLLRDMRARVNLIPFHPFSRSAFHSPAAAAVCCFQERLLAAGIWVTVRASKGVDIAAACGQLAAMGEAGEVSASRRPAGREQWVRGGGMNRSEGKTSVGKTEGERKRADMQRRQGVSR